MKVVGLGLTEYAKPFLRFDELMLACIMAWNTLLALMEVDLNFAFGLLFLQMPWLGLLWFTFDGQFDHQNNFN